MGFDGESVVTPAQVAVIIARLLGVLPRGESDTFSDTGEIPEWAVDGFANVVAAGTFQGDP